MTRALELPNAAGFAIRDAYTRQSELIASLVSLTKELRAMKDTRPKKIQWLRQHLADVKNGWNAFEALPLPLNAAVEVCGVRSDDAIVFKSHLMPIKLTFLTADGSEHPVMFKLGDDLRQD